MFRLRSRLSVVQPTKSKLILRSAPGRRMTFGTIAALLLIAFFTGVNWEADFSREAIVGTLVYFGLTLICVAVAAWGKAVQVDLEHREISFVGRIFGAQVRRSAIDSSEVRSLVIQGARFLKDAERPQPGLLNTRFRGYVDRRNTYYKLFLELAETRKLLEDSTELADLDSAGQAMADFLQVPLRREEI